jgi:hypothetical protein
MAPCCRGGSAWRPARRRIRVQIAEAERRRRPCVPVDGRMHPAGIERELLLHVEAETHRKNRVSVDDVVSRPASRQLVVTAPPGGSRRSRSRRSANRTQEVVADWLTGAALLRRATACSGGGVAATTRGGRQTRCRPGPSTTWVPSSRWIGHVRSRSGEVRTRRHSVVVLDL